MNTTSNKNKTTIILIASTCALLGATGFIVANNSGSSSPDGEEKVKSNATSEENATKSGEQSMSIDIAFITHLDANMAEQDAYLEREPGSGKIYRATVGDHDMNAPLYRSVEKIPHNPFDPATVGPYPKGDPLGVTLGEWLKHRGTGSYRYENGTGTLDLSFEGLVPNGLYTMWHAFMPAVPPEPFTGILDLPLGAPDGSESTFRADENGKARFQHSFKPGLQMSDVWTSAVLAIAYHSDDKSHGGSPGEAGFNVHVPLFAMLPKRAGIE